MMRNFLKGFNYAFKGICYAFRTQIHFKFQLYFAAGVAALGYYTGLNTSEWLWIASAIAIVIMGELFNTAIELLVDHFSPGYHIQAGIIKDVASAAVLVAGLLALIIGLLIFVPKYF